MEFLEGTTISEVTASGVLLPLEDVNNMIIQLADALNYAHNEGVVHRDIKAANILVLPGMKVKIMDFGIARLPSSDLTQSGQFIGTPNYMSPEQIDGKTQVDGRSDLFSLGVIFYMLLTGERPFSGDSFNTVSYRIVNVHHVPPKTLNPNVPEVYNAILSKLLAKEPSDRYQTGSELVADVKRLMANISEIEELRETDLESTIAGSPPPPLPEPRALPERVTGRMKAVKPESMTLSGTGSSKKVTSLAALIALVLVLTAGSIYFIQSTSNRKEAEIVQAPLAAPVLNQNALEALSKENGRRIKWDLAMKYMESGLYDKSIKELNGILATDPNNEDARKLMELVEEKKTIEAKKKAEPPPPAMEIPVAKTPVRPIVKVTKPEQPIIVDMAPPEKLAAVDFEFEHGFPSGSVYIFTNEKLAFEGSLSGEEKKVLIFRNYKGKLTGSLKVPVGETNILVHVVCKEKSVSASKRITVQVTESGQPHSLRIKYLKTPKQLELKWI
jgi:serine/threonine protein kinase